MVSITFDKETSAFYLKVHDKHGHIVKTYPLGNDKFLDVDEKGHIVGMEILSDDDHEILEVIRRTEEIELSV